MQVQLKTIIFVSIPDETSSFVLKMARRLNLMARSYILLQTLKVQFAVQRALH